MRNHYLCLLLSLKMVTLFQFGTLNYEPPFTLIGPHSSLIVLLVTHITLGLVEFGSLCGVEVICGTPIPRLTNKHEGLDNSFIDTDRG